MCLKSSGRRTQRHSEGEASPELLQMKEWACIEVLVGQLPETPLDHSRCVDVRAWYFKPLADLMLAFWRIGLCQGIPL